MDDLVIIKNKIEVFKNILPGYTNVSAAYKTSKIISYSSGSTVQLATRFQTRQELNEKGVTGIMRNLENSHQKETEGLGLKKRLFTKQLSNSQKTSERYLKRIPQRMLQEIIVLNSCTEVRN